MTKVLHVAESIRGGCGTYLNELLPLLIAEHGAHNVRVLAPDRHLAQIADVAPGVIRSFRRPTRVLGIPFLALRLATTLREFRPDVIHAHSTFAGAVARIMAMLPPRSAPIVYCPHGWVFDTATTRFGRRLLEAAERLLSRWCAAVICISQAERAAGQAAGISPAKLVLIHNGIRPHLPGQAAARWAGSRRRVLFVGRLDRQKGVDVLLEAVRGLGELLSVRIIGESVLSERGPPERRENVEYLGWLDHDSVAAQIRACDVVVMPSRWEGFGLVALEAMRLAKPVIASAVGGLTEIVVDGVTGRLVPAGEPQALRAALIADAADPAAASAMGRAGRERLLRLFSIDRTRTELNGLYARVCARPPEPALAALAAAPRESE